MSVGHLMANTREDIHVTASVMAEMERKKEQSRRCHGFLWNQDDTAPALSDESSEEERHSIL